MAREGLSGEQLEVLVEVAKAWSLFPMLRLGQLIENVVPPGRDLFYIPDEELVELIKRFVAKQKTV